MLPGDIGWGHNGTKRRDTAKTKTRTWRHGDYYLPWYLLTYFTYSWFHHIITLVGYTLCGIRCDISVVTLDSRYDDDGVVVDDDDVCVCVCV